MHRQVNHKIRKHFNEAIYHVARYTEILLSVVILIVIGLASIPLVYELFHMSVFDIKIDFLRNFCHRRCLWW